MYQPCQHFEVEQQQVDDASGSSTSSSIEEEGEEEPPPSYAKILQWSIEKLSVRGVAAAASRRAKQPADLRRNLLIAGTMGKARAAILRQRALNFLEARPQMLPPAGLHQHQQQYHHQQHHHHQQQQPPEQEQESTTASAFGLFPAPSLSPSDNDESDAVVEVNKEDALNASTEAIVMSTVELSIRGLEEEEELPPPPPPPSTPPRQQQQQQQQPTTRKRKQPIKKPPPLQLEPQPPVPPSSQESPQQQQRPLHSPAKRTRQPSTSSLPTSVIESAELEESDSEPEFGGGGGSVRGLQASFVDLSMTTSSASGGGGGGSGCRQQQQRAAMGQLFGGSLNPCWSTLLLPSGPPECHSFA